MLYKQEFGQDFDLGFDLESHPYLIDKSWHNDLCPSFYLNVGEQYYVLWVDYADEEQREEDTPRYMITKGVNEGTNNKPEIYASDSDAIFQAERDHHLSGYLNSLL